MARRCRDARRSGGRRTRRRRKSFGGARIEVREPGGDSPEAVSEDGAALEEERGIEEAEVVLSGRRGDDAGKNGESRLPLPGWTVGYACVRLQRLRSTSQEAGSCDPVG
jgi:hypothetical protein